MVVLAILLSTGSLIPVGLFSSDIDFEDCIVGFVFLGLLLGMFNMILCRLVQLH